MANLSSSSVGRHSELLAMAALIADGWCVHEATTPEAHDIFAYKKDEVGNITQSQRIQVKTIVTRERDGHRYYVIRGLKNSGHVYTTTDCDAFIGVVEGRVFMTACTGLTEYWIKAEEVAERWTELAVTINNNAEAI